MAELAPRAIEEAADWMMRLSSGRVSAADRAACARWQQASSANADAWRLAQSVAGDFGALPSALAKPVLNRPVHRRTLVKAIAVLAVAPGVLAALRLQDAMQWGADVRTATGVRRNVVLADGSAVILNGDSALDVAFDSTQRLLRLRRGEVMVQTAPDAAARPFHVTTAHGTMQALGTRFVVRVVETETRLAVLEHAVRVRLANGVAHTVAANQQASFTATAITAPREADAGAGAWVTGMLVADRMRLDDFTAELARYHTGLLRCAPDVADLRVSGSFPIDAPVRALNMLAATLPVQVHARFNGLWLTVAQK